MWDITKMNLSKVNLNLLVAFDALMKERHVTRAGAQLYITQSAMSNILKQLRELFQDELFVRGAASSMTPTPRALELAQSIKIALEKTEQVFAKLQPFNPKIERRKFILAMSDYAEFVLLPTLVQKITHLAPGIDIEIKHLNYLKENNIKEMEEDKFDLAIGIYSKIPSPLEKQVLFTDDPVCVGDSNNPIFKKTITMEEYIEAKHLFILFFEAAEHSYAHKLLQKLNRQRRIVVTVPRTLSAIYALPNTQLIATVLKRVVDKIGKNLKLKSQPIPFEYPLPTVMQVWHPKNGRDPAQVWLRNLIKEIAEKI